MDRKPLREYNADKHCGVWDAETKRHCTRALTCKSHSVLLKRKIEGRSRPFDELVAAHKKAQAEAAAKANCGNMPQQATPTISSIQVRPFTPTVSVTAPPSVASIRTPLLTQVVTGSGVPTCTVATPTKDPNEESLYYTTEAVIQQPKKVGSSPMKISTPPTPGGGSGGMCSSGGRMDRKPLREYNADKHCGVWDAETKRHCTRALTCKSHSVLLKRKIEGRSRPFDELVAAHKKAQAEAAAKANCGNMPQQATPTISSIQVRPFTPTVSVTAPPSVASIRTPLLTQVVTGSGVPTCTVATPTKDPNEESLYYTTDHPRPLAVCGFKGGRRVGGLIVTGGRNHIFTRKLVRVAITAGTAASFGGAGFHRIRPRVFIGGGGAPTVTAIETPIQQHQSSYVLNYNLSGNIKRPGGGGGGLNLTPLPPGGVVIPESFKTDIQDFKGGIKFELGRKIKHILPSGSEVTK